MDDFDVYILNNLLGYLSSLSTCKLVRQSSNVYNFRCPICGDSQKSLNKKRGFLYTTPKLKYHCFNCGAHISGLKLFMHISGKTYTDIQLDWINALGGKEPGGDFEIEKKNFTSKSENRKELFAQIKTRIKPLTDDAKNYLINQRKITIEMIEEHNLCSYFIGDKEFVFIPFFLNGQMFAYQINNFNKFENFPKYKIYHNLYSEETTPLIWGLDKIDITYPYIFILEGVFDAFFVKNGISITGINCSSEKIELIKTKYPKMEMVLAFDNDQPGKDAMIKYAKKYPFRFKFFDWGSKFPSCKDVNSIFINYALEKNPFFDVNFLGSYIKDATTFLIAGK